MEAPDDGDGAGPLLAHDALLPRATRINAHPTSSRSVSRAALLNEVGGVRPRQAQMRARRGLRRRVHRWMCLAGPCKRASAGITRDPRAVLGGALLDPLGHRGSAGRRAVVEKV